MFQIASNTKLFTATAIGFLVEEGKIDWDKPVKKYVPQIQFYNDELNANVTIRDMLSHRTGISRHDYIWYKSDFTREELFDRIKFLEPSIPLRQGFLYNNMMYAAAGQITQYLSGKTWEEFIKSNIFTPLNMSHTIFVVEDMEKQPDYMKPYYEKRDTTILLPYPLYTSQQGIGPAGSIISSIEDLSNWLIAQMNGGKFNKKQVIPSGIIKETMKPSIPTSSVPDKYFEYLNAVYGMVRGTSSYKGHYITQHGGAIGGIYSNISFMPADSIGIIVFTNGAHAGQLPVILENRGVARVLSGLFEPMSGGSIQQKRSFLADKKDTIIGSKLLTLTDDPYLPRGLGSKYYDGDGFPARKRDFFKEGTLNEFLIDWYYSRKLGWEPTSGSVSNLIIPPGARSVDEIVRDLGRCILITDYIGGNSNSTTGDFSVGIIGKLFEKGRFVQNVAEMNIADNHLKFWKKLVEVANDPWIYSQARLPSLVFEGVVVSGV